MALALSAICISSGLEIRRNIHKELPTHLKQTQILQTILNQFLYPALLRHLLVLTEGVSRFPTSIFAKIVVGELV